MHKISAGSRTMLLALALGGAACVDESTAVSTAAVTYEDDREGSGGGDPDEAKQACYDAAHQASQEDGERIVHDFDNCVAANGEGSWYMCYCEQAAEFARNYEAWARAMEACDNLPGDADPSTGNPHPHPDAPGDCSPWPWTNHGGDDADHCEDGSGGCDPAQQS